MKAKELKTQSVAELLQLKGEIEKKRLVMRMQFATKSDKAKPATYGQMRKDVARINTVLRMKQLNGEIST